MQASLQFLQVEGTPLRPQRILRREWKRNKPHLPKSTSLPILQLTPTDRPIFTCHQCGFVNTLIPLCLWCCWTSEVAHREFDMSMPRVRRASAPSRVFWKYNAITAAISSDDSKQTISAQVVDDHVSLGLKAVLELDIPGGKFRHSKRVRDRQVLSIDAEAEQRGRRSPNSGRSTQHKRHHRKNVFHETFLDAVHGIQGRVTKATSSGTSSARSQLSESRPRALTVGARPVHRPIPTSVSIQPSPRSPSLPTPAPPNGVDCRRTIDAVTRKTFTTKPLCSIPIVIDFKNFDDSHHDFIKSRSVPNNLNPNFPLKTLRRKKGVSLFRTSPPRSAPSSLTPLVLPLPQHPQSSSHVKQNPQSSSNYIPLSLSASLSHNQSHIRSKSQPTNNVPLGHPNRPYYSAIRPNMSRPSSPVGFQSRPQSSSSVHPSRPLSLPPPARVPSPGILSMLSTSSVFSTSVFEEHEYAPPMSSASVPSSAYDHVRQPPFTFAGSMSRHRAGFSLSGETELRMAIARDQDEMLGPEGAGEAFKFRDMRKTSRRETTVMKGVHKLKKGLKDFVLKAL